MCILISLFFSFYSSYEFFKLLELVTSDFSLNFEHILRYSYQVPYLLSYI